MKKSGMQGKSNVEKNKSNYGYWMYADGSSYWGIGVHKGMECPLQTTKELHNNKFRLINS